MPPALPRRLVGYGAYNLCFDKLHGRITDNPADPDFFASIRQRAPFVNLVKVIVYRKSGIEGLKASRRLPLYTPAREINDAFVENLRALVDRAASLSPMFFVQVCIFSYHSVADLDELPKEHPNDPPKYNPIPKEQPENVPYALVPPPPPTVIIHPIDYARWWFSPGTDARTNAQRDVVARVGEALAGRPNVIWEIGNELRIKEDAQALTDHRVLAQWTKQMYDKLVARTGTDINVTCSTGISNELVMANNVPLNVYDYHSGQWDVGRYYTGIPRARQRAAGYNPNAPLIINDDGVPRDTPRNRPNVAGWAKTAFQNGLHYSTKASYPPAEDYSQQQIDGLRDAVTAVP